MQKDEQDEVPSLFTYFSSELRRDYLLENNEATFTVKRDRIYTFIRIPKELEKFLWYGFMQCADAFLFIFTLLPLRVFLALLQLSTNPWRWLVSGSHGPPLAASGKCDILKALILVLCTFMMAYVDTSVIYHMVRGQAVIKLYIFFNMLEVGDKLVSSFGQDILDSLFWTATEPRSRKREHIFSLLFHIVLAVFYVFLHAILVLFQATTLHVAFNSHSKSLLTIMMSNNFVELKSSVFKKFEKNNLFQMSCSDVRERFHYQVLLFIVTIRNMTEFSWNVDHFWVLVPDILMVVMFEFMVDWVKHCFITKFNDIPAEVYSSYRASLAYDMLASRQKNAFSDHSDQISRRMGFIPLPLAVLLSRIVCQSVKFSGYMSLVNIFVAFLCLLSLKVLVGIFVLGKTSNIITEHKEKRQKHLSTSSANDINSVSNEEKADSFGDLESLQQEPPLSHVKPMFSNSSVSLQSLNLNEAVLDASSMEWSDHESSNKQTTRSHDSINVVSCQSQDINETNANLRQRRFYPKTLLASLRGKKKSADLDKTITPDDPQQAETASVVFKIGDENIDATTEFPVSGELLSNTESDKIDKIPNNANLKEE